MSDIGDIKLFVVMMLFLFGAVNAGVMQVVWLYMEFMQEWTFPSHARFKKLVDQCMLGDEHGQADLNPARTEHRKIEVELAKALVMKSHTNALLIIAFSSMFFILFMVVYIVERYF